MSSFVSLGAPVDRMPFCGMKSCLLLCSILITMFGGGTLTIAEEMI